MPKTPVKRPAKNKKNGNGDELALERLVEELIARYMEALEKNEIKASVADLVRLRALQKELYPRLSLKRPVTWIDGWD